MSTPAHAGFITLQLQTANPESAFVHMFIHFDSATSSSPALHCFSAYRGCLESEPVTIETTMKDKVEERGRDAAACTGVDDGRTLVMLQLSDWLLASCNPAHPCVS